MHHPEILQLIRKAVECELEGTWIFQRYTMAELAEIYNGIGPDWIPEKLRRFCTKWGWLFEPAALIHDVEYFLGGSEEDFQNSNERFKRNGIKLARAEFSAWNPCRFVWISRARRWGNWCRIFGRTGYHFVSDGGKVKNDAV
ncbi:MAG: hypothetical protein BWY31_03326 [Lentisphaerae bacterium ADurb.Bin242]|nr:MAG: hypothetical protein BWY31_03326 [Lentisphaerae bacterium ADurb.Bin242]